MKTKKAVAGCILFCVLFIFSSSCKKGPGKGGQASIKGKVWVRKYDIKFSTLYNEYNGTGEDVYLIYGDDITFDDHVKTNYDGVFEFPYLRKGSYKIYAYSNDSATAVATGGIPTWYPPVIAIIKDITITDRKQIVDAGTITILKN